MTIFARLIAGISIALLLGILIYIAGLLDEVKAVRLILSDLSTMLGDWYTYDENRNE